MGKLGIVAGGATRGYQTEANRRLAEQKLQQEEQLRARALGIQEQKNTLTMRDQFVTQFNKNLTTQLNVVKQAIESADVSGEPREKVKGLVDSMKMSALDTVRQLNELGANINEGTIIAQFDQALKTPSPTQVAEQEAKAAGITAEAKERAKAKVSPDLFVAINKADPTDRINVKMVDGKLMTLDERAVDESKYNLAKVPTMEATGTPTELGLTTATETALQKGIVSQEKALNTAREALSAYKKNPQAAGAIGALRETFSGLSGQIPGGIGEALSGWFDKGGRITDTRTLGSLVMGQLIPAITGDTSGRYSDRDVEWARKTLKTLDPTASAEQVTTVLERIISIMESDVTMDRKFAGWPDSERPAMKNGLFVISSQEQYDQLKSGDEYIEDGKRYRKP